MVAGSRPRLSPFSVFQAPWITLSQPQHNTDGWSLNTAKEDLGNFLAAHARALTSSSYPKGSGPKSWFGIVTSL